MSKNKGGLRVFAVFIVLAIITISIISFAVMTGNKGVYETKKIGDLDFKVSNIVQFSEDNSENLEFKDVEIEIGNTNTDKDYNLKLEWNVPDGDETKTKTVFVDVVAETTQEAKVALFSDADIDNLGIYTKEIVVKNGDSVIYTIPVKHYVGTIGIDKSNSKVRISDFVVAEYNADNIVAYVDIDDSKTLDKIEVKELNESKVTVTSVNHEEVTLNSNKWEKVTINFDKKGSVLENELYKDGFKVDLKSIYDDSNETISINEDFVFTSDLSEFKTKQKATFDKLSLVN